MVQCGLYCRREGRLRPLFHEFSSPPALFVFLPAVLPSSPPLCIRASLLPAWTVVFMRTTAVLAPSRGWAEASPLRRSLSLLAPLLFAAVLVAFLLTPSASNGTSNLSPESLEVSAIVFSYLLVIPGYSLMRVLRPYRSEPSPWVVARHVVAAFGGALGWVVVALGVCALLGAFSNATSFGLGLLFFCGLPALFLGPISLLWALVDFLRMRGPERSPSPAR